MTWHDMPHIRIIDASPVVPEGYELMQHAYARQDPAIRYRGFEMSLRQYAPKPKLSDSGLKGIEISAPETVPGLIMSSLLLPLEIARKCRHITHRREGFEIEESKKHIQAVRNGWF